MWRVLPLREALQLARYSDVISSRRTENHDSSSFFEIAKKKLSCLGLIWRRPGFAGWGAKMQGYIQTNAYDTDVWSLYCTSR